MAVSSHFELQVGTLKRKLDDRDGEVQRLQTEIQTVQDESDKTSLEIMNELNPKIVLLTHNLKTERLRVKEAEKNLENNKIDMITLKSVSSDLKQECNELRKGKEMFKVNVRLT